MSNEALSHRLLSIPILNSLGYDVVMKTGTIAPVDGGPDKSKINY